MTEPVLDPRVRGSAGSRAKPSGSSQAGPSTPPPSDATREQPDKQLEGRLQEIEKRLLTRFNSLVTERLEPLMDKKMTHAVGVGGPSGLGATKEALTQVIHGVLFESGLLEKFVHRAVDQKLRTSPAGGSAPEGLCKEEIGAVVEDKVAASLSGETLKVMIDDKFRAITLYLKTDVIPKAVAQILKKSNAQT